MNSFGEMSQDLRVEAVRLGQVARALGNLGEVADLARIDYRHRQIGLRQTSHHQPLIPASRFQHDHLWGQRPQLLGQGGERRVAVGHPPRRLARARRTNRHIQPGFGHINPHHARSCQRSEDAGFRIRHGAHPLGVLASLAHPARQPRIPPCVIRTRSSPVSARDQPRHLCGFLARHSATTNASLQSLTLTPATQEKTVYRARGR